MLARKIFLSELFFGVSDFWGVGFSFNSNFLSILSFCISPIILLFWFLGGSFLKSSSIWVVGFVRSLALIWLKLIESFILSKESVSVYLVLFWFWDFSSNCRSAFKFEFNIFARFEELFSSWALFGSTPLVLVISTLTNESFFRDTLLLAFLGRLEIICESSFWVFKLFVNSFCFLSSSINKIRDFLYSDFFNESFNFTASSLFLNAFIETRYKPLFLSEITFTLL